MLRARDETETELGRQIRLDGWLPTGKVASGNELAQVRH